MHARELDELCINTLRFLSVDAVQKAKSGHPGLPLGAATIVYSIWDRFLKFNPRNPSWADRDRFVLSAGHGCALLYSMLHLTGFDLPLEELKRFRQWGTRTPGHPEYRKTPGVEATTGPLGQGFANAVGMAIGEASLAARFNRPGYEIVNHFTYVVASDGDLMEGVSYEAASLAGHLGLGKLIVLYDNNHMTIEGETVLHSAKIESPVSLRSDGTLNRSMTAMISMRWPRLYWERTMPRIDRPSFLCSPISATAAPISRTPLLPTENHWGTRKSD